MLLKPRHAPTLREDDIVDQDGRLPTTLLQRRHQSPDDLDRVRVVVVVQHLAQEEGRRVVDGLRAEEVVLLEGHAAAAEIFLVVGELDGGDVLNDEMQRGELLDMGSLISTSPLFFLSFFLGWEYKTGGMMMRR